MPELHYESRLLRRVIFFMVLNSIWLFALRIVLMKLEAKEGFLFKPDALQMLALALLLLLYHFAFFGLQVFSTMGSWQKGVAVGLLTLLFCSLLYLFVTWYMSITRNPFLFSASSLPWYAIEKNKFFLANSPFLIFLIFLFATRLKQMLHEVHPQA